MVLCHTKKKYSIFVSLGKRLYHPFQVTKLNFLERRVFHFGHAIFSFEKYYPSNIVELSTDDKGGQRG